MWTEILPMTELRPGHPATAHNFFAINNSERWTHLRLNIYPGLILGECMVPVMYELS